jgi:hypothetical protein
MRKKLIWFGLVLSFAVAQAPADATSPYVVDGLALGESVHFGSAAYNAYQCRPSDQFPDFTWCQRKTQEKRGKNEILSSNSILHRSDGTAVYLNRVIRPAILSQREANDEITRLSNKFGEKPHVVSMPERKDLPRAIIASWGKVDLAPLTQMRFRLWQQVKALMLASLSIF